MLPVTATTGKVDFIGHRVSWVVPVLGLSLVAAAWPTSRASAPPDGSAPSSPRSSA
jgi:hypothetical protein